MSKTIMIADETYDKLKKMKDAQGISFTKLLDRLSEKSEREKRYARILALRGTWKDTKEDSEVAREIKEGWKRWNKRYA